MIDRSVHPISHPNVTIRGKFAKIARLTDEWYEDLDDPAAFVRELKLAHPAPDVFTFWQRLPDVAPKYQYRFDLDPVAAIPLSDYPNWWNKQIDAKTRNMVRRAEKKGVVVRETKFDDEFVRGMVALFNETPVCQGKPFWHYGKDFETIKKEFGRFLFREEIFGAYLGDELIGFIFLAYAGKFAHLGQIISKIAHRDKAPNNALIAKAVERCVERGLPYLGYAKWVEGSLGEFKRSNGFQKFDLPRYYVPVTAKGRLFVGLRLYRGLNLLPGPALRLVKDIRRNVMERRAAKLPESTRSLSASTA